MQIESFKVFCDLVATESFTKAAQLSEVTQSAVSQTVSGMERIYKSVLIERSKKHFRLTPEGQVVHDYGRGIVSTFDSIAHRMQEIRDVISGNIQVAAVYSIGLYDLPPRLLTFLKAYPTVNVHVTYRRANQVYEDVAGNVVDLGLVAYPLHEKNVEIIALREEPLVLICSPNHPFAEAKTLKLQDLQGQKFVHFAPDLPTRRAIERVFKAAKVGVRTVLEFDNIDTLKRAVEIEAGVAIVPQPTIAQEASKKTLVEVKLEGKGLVRPIAAIHKKGKVFSPAMKEFLAVLKSKVPPARS